MASGVSSKVKLTGRDDVGTNESVPRTFPLTLVALGAALVLVTYVSPMATCPRPLPTSVRAPAPAPGSSAR